MSGTVIATTAPTFHPASKIFPLLKGEKFDELVTDIKQHGLREAIVRHQDGSILDGRNRYRACEAAGVEPRYREWDGVGSPIVYVVSLNLKRRHLTASQQAMLRARAEVAIGRERRRGGDRRSESFKTEKAALKDVATALPVSDDTTAKAHKVLNHGNADLIADVDSGRTSVHAAAKTVEQQESPSADQRCLCGRPGDGKPSDEHIEAPVCARCRVLVPRRRQRFADARAAEIAENRPKLGTYLADIERLIRHAESVRDQILALCGRYEDASDDLVEEAHGLACDAPSLEGEVRS